MYRSKLRIAMQSNKSRENRRGNNRRRGRKEEKYAVARMKDPKSDEFCPYAAANSEDKIGNVEQESSLDRENSDNGVAESSAKSSLMCPSLHRQLQTHKNVLRLLHEYKLVSTQINGQRILSIQPIRWSGPTPGIDCEIFVGRIPKTIFEDTLYPLFNTIGEVFQIRLMVDMAELTRGYCFIMYTNPLDASRAITQLDQYEISPGKKIRVLASVNKCKLYIGPLPWHIASEEVIRVIYASAWDIEYVSIYRFLNHDAAYAIVSFKSHRNAALARRKLRPERLFKCNEVHVEWARVDWNPSNVYEDRGMVDDKGEVQITRKYVQSKKTGFSPSPSMQDDLKHFRKQQIRPICPPDNDNGQNRAAAGDNSRYSSMLNVSSSMIMDDHSSLNSADNSKMMTDINDNVELSDRYCKKEDTDAESFRNFDIWNSNLVPPLSPTDPSSLENHELSDKSLTESPPCDWTNNAKYWPPKTSSFSGYQYPSESGNPDHPPRPCYNYLSNKSKAEQSRPVAVDAVRYQAPASHQDQQAVAPYYRLHPLHPSSYLYPNDTASYSQSSFVRDNQMRAAACANYEHRWSRWCNGRLDATINSQNPLTLGKRDECGFHCDGKLMEDNTALSAVPSFVPSNYAPAYAPGFVLNFAPMYALNSNAAPRNASSRLIAAFGMASGDNEKRLRPILKQASDQL